MGARNKVGIGFSYRPARLQRLAESIPWLLKSFKIPSLCLNFRKSMGTRKYVGIGLSYRPARLQVGGIDSLESISGLHKISITQYLLEV
jgi:hypothetical protein